MADNIPDTNTNEPSISSLLVNNTQYLKDVVNALETKIVPDIQEIKNVFVETRRETRIEKEQAQAAAIENQQEAARMGSDLGQAQAAPQSSFGGSKIGGAFAGIGAAGAGIGAFFLALAGAEAIMTKFGAGDNLKNLLTNVAEGLSAFSTKEFVALGTVLATGALFGSFGGAHEAIQAGVGIAAMGAGLAGFLISLSAADAVMGSFGGDGSTLSPLLNNIADGLSAFNNESMIALGTALATGAGLGALFGIGKAGKAGFGIAAVGAGIAGFLAALSGADWAASKLGADGSSIGPLLTNIGEGLSAFSSEGFIALGAVIGAGGALGALFPSGALGATVGIAAVGAGIGAFLAALSAADWVAGKLGSKGENIGPLLKNIGEGLSSFKDLNAEQILSIGPALIGLEAGLLALFAGEGIKSVLSSGMDAIKGAWNWITGNDEPVEKKGIIQNLIDELEPLKDLDLADVDKLDKFSSSLNNFASSINELGDLNVGDLDGNIADIAKNISKTLPVIKVMVEGGSIKDGFFDVGNPNMDFGPEGEGGLLNPNLKMEELEKKVRQIRNIFGQSLQLTPAMANQPSFDQYQSPLGSTNLTPQTSTITSSRSDTKQIIVNNNNVVGSVDSSTNVSGAMGGGAGSNSLSAGAARNNDKTFGRFAMA